MVFCLVLCIRLVSCYDWIWIFSKFASNTLTSCSSQGQNKEVFCTLCFCETADVGQIAVYGEFINVIESQPYTRMSSCYQVSSASGDAFNY